MGELNMEMFEFEVTENGSTMKFKGETMNTNKDSAIKEIKEWYAMELGTVTDEIFVKII